MIVNVRSGSGGFANYTIEGTELKARNKEKIEIVGDPFFTEKIAEQQGTGYFKILVSPEKKLTNEEMHEILNEAVENIFVGFKKDEYNYSAVLHQDTEKSHWHIIVPKQNLLTHQQLRLYMHDIDTKRYKAIQDTIALNHNLLTMKEAKKILADTKETTYEKNSTKPIQYTYNLAKNDDKKLAQQQVKELIKNNIDTVNSINDIKELIHKNTDLKVVTDNGYNRKNDFHYITVQDKNSKKTSVRGELFSKDFFKQTKQEQRDQLQINHKSYTEVEKELLKKKIRSDLRRENEKRYAVVQKYGRKLKLSIRQEQREVNHKIRKEENDTARTNVAESPRRSERSINRRKRKQNTPLAERAVQIEQARIRAIKAIRETRERVVRENDATANAVFREVTTNSRRIREQSQRDSGYAQTEYRRIREPKQDLISQSENTQQTVDRVAEPISRYSQFFGAVREYSKQFSDTIKNLRTRLKDKYNEFIRAWNRLDYGLKETKEIIANTTKEKKPELSINDVEKFRNSLNKSIDYNNKQVQQNTRGYSMSR